MDQLPFYIAPLALFTTAVCFVIKLSNLPKSSARTCSRLVIYLATSPGSLSFCSPSTCMSRTPSPLLSAAQTPSGSPPPPSSGLRLPWENVLAGPPKSACCLSMWRWRCHLPRNLAWQIAHENPLLTFPSRPEDRPSLVSMIVESPVPRTTVVMCCKK